MTAKIENSASILEPLIDMHKLSAHKDILSFTIVAVGASAGGLAALERFFLALPAVKDMAFVVVTHLPADGESALSSVLQRFTSMVVVDVSNGMTLSANHLYINPPNANMTIVDGVFTLTEPSDQREQRYPIDFFFKSLALDQHQRAVGIVFSGCGSDGSVGVRAIKESGGIVIAQLPESAEYNSMPMSAIATGVIDYILAPQDIPSQLLNAVVNHIPVPAAMPVAMSEGVLGKIFLLLRVHTGHDFSHYKPGTIHRRIMRRMAVHQIYQVEGYLLYLEQAPDEIEALFRDLLIGVTSFFRDHDVFQELEHQIIPRLFSDKGSSGSVIRVWSTGCSTGEEAYSIAILLQEYMEVNKLSHEIQVFATDIDSRAISVARSGFYPASIASDITPERLARYFTIETDGNAYRIQKVIRDMLIFSEQNVIKDPPFSRLDLISCRNLMIYLDAELQKKLIPLFHYALNPGGMLFLGTSEGIGDFSDLFALLDRKAKLFQRRADLHSRQRLGQMRFLPFMTSSQAVMPRTINKTVFPAKVSLRELTEQVLLQHMTLVGALINSRGDILYLHGRTGGYLELPEGESGINNIVKMAREGLRRALESALHDAIRSQEITRVENLQVVVNSQYALVNLCIRPVPFNVGTTSNSPLYLVILEKASGFDSVHPTYHATSMTASNDNELVETDTVARVAVLKEELRAKDEYLKSAHEELERSNEDLKSANEEMQSVNEELQSTNEELETSKEELQSVNEELATVNAELQTKVLDLSRTNNDMNNLLAGTGIATIFVDYQLCILRFTPAAGEIINLILSDVGRPVGHIVSNLVNYTSMVADASAVLETLKPKELKVQSIAGLWYMMRIRPYRTLGNVIEGVVITFVDITDMKLIEDELAVATHLLRLSVQNANASQTAQPD